MVCRSRRARWSGRPGTGMLRANLGHQGVRAFERLPVDRNDRVLRLQPSLVRRSAGAHRADDGGLTLGAATVTIPSASVTPR